MLHKVEALAAVGKSGGAVGGAPPPTENGNS